MKIELVEVLTEPQITLEEVKNALRIKGTGHEAELVSVLESAITYAERIIDSTIGEKKWKVTTEFDYDEDTLPRGPVSDMTETEVDGKNVYEYTGGYEDLPANIKRLVLLICKRIYDLDDLAESVDSEISRLAQSATRQPML